jgi:hypothetical protein
MTATQTGINNTRSFYGSVTNMGDDTDVATVQGLLKANNWQGVVDFATTYPYYNFKKLPFTASDVDVGLNPWMLIAIDEDYSNDDLKGSVMAMRPYTGVGFCILAKGGIAIDTDGSVLATNGASVNAGTPTGSPFTIPYQDGKKSSWIMTQTSTGCLGFFKNSTAYSVLQDSGQVWTKQNSQMKAAPMNRSDGNLVPGATGAADPVGADVVTAFVNYAAELWSVASTDDGNLVFRSQKNNANQPIMISRDDNGWLCNGSMALYQADDMNISLEGYLDYFWQQFLGAGNEAFQWVSDIATTSLDWMEGAAMDSWAWIEDTSSDAWKAVENTWNDVEDELDDIGKVISDPDTWNPSKW